MTEHQTAGKSPRLYVEAALAGDVEVTLSGPQCHYLRNVMRLKPGAVVRFFNGRDGEWRATITGLGRKDGSAMCTGQTRTQEPMPDVHYLFAPLKQARLDYMVQKATEMGAAVLQPVQTRFTMVSRVKQERVRANAIEAAEQCNLLGIPEVRELIRFDRLLEQWPQDRALIYCDEAADTASPLAALGEIKPGPVAVLIGPEGGFSGDERNLLRAHPGVRAISLGPRIMRADTAAVAALAIIQAVLGDWA